MKRPQRLLAIVLFCLSTSALQAQTPLSILDSLSSALLAQNSTQPAIYAHIDKPVQTAGSGLWFKVYLYQQTSYIPYMKSTTVYADLVNAAGSVVHRMALESSDLRLEGYVPLPRELAAGTYYLRVYTEEILKRSASGVFLTPVYIYNPAVPGSWANAMACAASYGDIKPTPGIRFQPEGTHLVNGIDNLVAVQALDAAAKPVAVSGIIKDNRDSIITRFSTDESGLGKFLLSPVRARKYRAIVNQQEIPLPDAPVSAYQLAVTKEDATSITFRVALSDLLYTRAPSSYIIGISKGRVCFTAAGKGMYLVTVPKNKFPEGIATFYLYGDDRQLASTRKVSIAKTDVRVSVESDKKQYMRRSNVKLNISINDSAGNPAIALLSVAVTDDNSLAAGMHTGFREHAWKQSAGIPGWAPVSTAEQRDILLLLYPVAPRMSTDTGAQTGRGLTLSGRLTTSRNTPVANQPFSLFSEQERSIVMSDTTDAQGFFSVAPLRYYDSTKFMLYADVPVSDWKLQVFDDTIDSKNFTALNQYCYEDSSARRMFGLFEKSRADTFLVGNTRVWLQDVIVRSRKKKAQPDAERKRNSFSRIITREQLSKQSLSTTANAVKMVPGVMMVNGKLTIRGGMAAVAGDGNVEPLVIVDGVPATAGSGVVNYINTIPPETIEYIEVLTGPEGAQYGTRAGNGVIIIKTGLPVYAVRKTDNVLSFYPKGYHLAPSFYQPDYSVEQVYGATFNDNRSTIYWNGDVMTDDKGKVSLQFYTADPKATYTVTVMGLTSRGNIIQQQITISRE